MRISDFPVLTFDTYGTLIDWESGIWNALGPLRRRLDRPMDRDDALAAFAEAETAVQNARPELRYSALLAVVHRDLAQRWATRPDADEDRRFGGSVGDWPAFDDAAASLAYLKRRHRLVTLTNCDQASYRGSSERLGDPWDRILTAEEIGSWKPSTGNFEFLLERVRADFGIGPDGIVHVAQSLFHDHAPAKAMGLRTIWIDRRGGRDGGATAPVAHTVEPDLRFDSMSGLVAAHRRELAGGKD